jgi:hypothetical protein
MHLQPKAPGRFHQRIAEKHKILVAGEDSLAVIAALDDVLRLTGDDVAGETCHWGILD